MTEALSEAVALRIGLAARALPDMDVRRLVEALVQVLGPELNDATLASVPGKRLSRALDDGTGAPEGDALERALQRLRGSAVAEAAEPVPSPEAGQPAAGTVRVACASNGGERLDGHFGNCARFLIYQVSPEATRLVARRDVASTAGGDAGTRARLELVGDCAVLFCVSIGGPAAAKVIRAGVHPVKRPEGGDARTVAAQLSPVLAGTPPPWLARAAGATRVASGGA